MGLNNPYFQPNQLKRDPALTGELGSGPPIDVMSIGQIYGETARTLNKAPELVDAADVAGFLLDHGASRGKFAEIFDPNSLSALANANMLPPMAEGISVDPAMMGSADAPIQDPVAGEFSRRFLNEAQQGMRRLYEQEFPDGSGTDLTEAAFPADIQRRIDVEKMNTGVRPHIGPWEPPVLEGVFNFAADQATKGAQWAAQRGDKPVTDLVETVSADERNTAPMWIFEQEDHKTYTDDWWKKEIAKSIEAGKEGRSLEATVGLLGATLGWMGRTSDSIAGTLQAVNGMFMAGILHDNWFGWRDDDLFEWEPEDEEYLRYLKDGDKFIGIGSLQLPLGTLGDIGGPQNLARARRELYNRNAEGWHWGFKGGLEGWATLIPEMMVRGPKIFGPMTNWVVDKIPALQRQKVVMAQRAKDQRWVPGPFKHLPLDKIPFARNMTYRERKKLEFDTGNRVTAMEGPFDDTIKAVVMNVPEISPGIPNIDEHLRRLTLLADPAGDIDSLPYIRNTPDLMDPNSEFRNILTYIRGHPNAFVGRNMVELLPEHQKAYDDLLRNGPRVSEETIRLYGSEEPPPLPLIELPFDKYKAPPIFGKGWSPDQPMGDFRDLVLRKYAESIGWGFGMRPKRYWFWGEGNTNAITYLSAKSKKHLGYVWLFARSGFAIMNAAGGTGMLMLEHGPGAARHYPRVHKWYKDLYVNSKGTIDPDKMTGYRAAIHGDQLGLQTKQLMGIATEERGAGSFFGDMPIVGDKLLPMSLPASWLANQGKLGSIARKLNNAPGFPGGAVAKVATFTENNQHRVSQLITGYQNLPAVFKKTLESYDLPQSEINYWVRKLHTASPDLVTPEGLRAAFGRRAIQLNQRTGRGAHTPEQLSVMDRGELYGYRGLLVKTGEIPQDFATPARLRAKPAIRFLAENPDSKPNFVMLDEDLLQKHFKRKVWTDNVRYPDGSILEKLPRNKFKTYEEFRAFVLEYEYLRTFNLVNRFDGQTRGQYETAAQELALRRYDVNIAKRSLPSNVLKAIKSADSDMAKLQDRIADSLIERLPRMPDSLTALDKMETAIQKMIRDSIEAGDPITPENIRSVARAVSDDLEQQIVRAEKLALVNSPDGTFGKLAMEIQEMFREAGAPIDGGTHRIMGEMQAHVMYQQQLMDKAMDRLGHRISTFGSAQRLTVDEGVNSRISQIIEKIQDQRRDYHQRSVKLMAEMRAANKKELDRRPPATAVTQRLKQRSRDRKMASIAQRTEQYNFAQTELRAENKMKLDRIYDELVSDEVMELVLQAERKVARRYKKKMPTEIPEERLRMLERARSGLRGLGVEIGKINEGLDLLKRSPGYKSAGRDQKDAMLSAAHRERATLLERAYVEFASNPGNSILELGDLRSQPVVTDEMARKIHRVVGAGHGKPGLETWLDENDPSVLIRQAMEEEKEIIEEAFEQIATSWNKPYALDPSPELLASGAAATRTTVDDIQRALNSAIHSSGQEMRATSNRVLFAYTYNRPEALLQAVTPYPYWSMKFFMYQVRHAVKNPVQYRMMAEIMRDWWEDTKHLPDHLKLTLHLWTAPDGTEILFDPKIMFGGPSATTVMTLMKQGEDPENASTALSLVQLINIIYAGRVHPWMSLMAHAALDTVGPERVQELVNNPAMYNEIFSKYGYIPPFEEQNSQLLGMNQRVVTSMLGQGMLGGGDVTPEVIYERGLTQSQRVRIGHAIADMVVQGVITDREAEQAIVDIQNNVPNPHALQGMKNYFSNTWNNLLANWGVGGTREYRPLHRRSRVLNVQYREAKAQGNFVGANEIVEKNPDIPVRWIINDDAEEQEKGIAKSNYWEAYHQSAQRRNQELDRTGVLDIGKQQEIREAHTERMKAVQDQWDLTEEDITPRKRDGSAFLAGEEISEPHLQSFRDTAIETLVKTFRETIRYKDFEDAQGLFDFEGYRSLREGWLEANVPDTMAVEFHAEFNKNVSLPEAVLDVYKTEFIGDYFSKTEEMTPDEKSAYMEQNQIPSLEKLVRLVKEAHPNRNWVNKDEDIDPVANDAKIRQVIQKSSLSLQGFLDVSAQDKMSRVARSSTDNPYSFKTKSGKLVTRETLAEYKAAYEDMSKFMASTPLRKEYDADIDRLSERYKAEMSRLVPMDFALGEDDAIREKYHGKDRGRGGSRGLIGRVEALKQQQIDMGNIAEWTERASEWFGSNEEYNREDALRAMRNQYYQVDRLYFATSDGMDWDAYKQAREIAFEEALDLGKAFNITAHDFRADLDQKKGASEAAWVFWQEKVIGPALEARTDAKDQFGRVDYSTHDSIVRKYDQTSMVGDLIPDIIARFPHLTPGDFSFIKDTRLPTFAEYWEARGFGSGRGTTTRPYYSGGDALAGIRAWMAQNPGQYIDKSLL